MRTTITLDDDVAEALRALAHERRQPFKRVVNDTIRSGLVQERPTPQEFRMTASAMGLRAGLDLDKALGLASSLEDEQLVGKLEQAR